MRLTPGLCPGVLRLRVRSQANPTALPPYGQWVQGQISLSIALQAGRDISFIIFHSATEGVFISCLSPCGWCKARRVMVLQDENIWACSRISRRLRHQMARRDIRINSKGFILVFVSPYCNKKRKGWISVFVNHIKSVKICGNQAIDQPQGRQLLSSHCKFTEYPQQSVSHMWETFLESETYFNSIYK